MRLPLVPPGHSWTTAQRRLFFATLIALVTTASAVRAQTGVSDDRVSLPDGPGSIDGVGDSVEMGGNMGSMSYSVPIEVPAGFTGVTPQLALSYSSAAGTSIMGVGWWLDMPAIERSSLRGQPSYVADDEFIADGSTQLVRVSRSGANAVYRARFEGGFVRYTWRDVGAAGYWVAENPDGTVSYYGADSTGRVVPESRLTGDGGATYRYMLVETVDVNGHRLRYDYRLSGRSPLPVRIGWVHGSSGEPRYSVELDYEARPDPISDCTPGFEELSTERLSAVRVRAGAEAVRSYRVLYEAESLSGGVSRVSRIERHGREGGLYPVVHGFAYSRSLGGVCADCEQPFVVDMGTLPGGGSVRTGEATLVDINGDALPDLVDTSGSGAHRFYLSELEGEGRARFSATPVESAVATGSEFRVGLPYVQVLDVNGDGFADLINGLSSRVVCNHGEGDWSREGCNDLSGTMGMPLEDNPAESGEADPLRTRFMDLDGDRRIDVLRTVGADALDVRMNRLDGFASLPGAQAIGRELDRDHLQFADMNGDGLLDPVVIDPDGLLRYRLHYGRARWSPWITATGLSLPSGTEQAIAEFEDVNGDGLDDVILVRGSTVRYAVNRNAGRFDAFVELDGADVSGELPVRGDTTTVLFADMNGSGTTDVVWIETTGRVRYLELFPIRPNLMSRVENGIGLINEVHYETSVWQQSSDSMPWQYRLPHSMNVVSRSDTWVTLTGGEGGEGLHEVTERRYRDGYYDGIERRFRGYARVESRVIADVDTDGQEPSRTVEEYDVGSEDPYRAGLMLRSQLWSGAAGSERAIREERHVYADCDLAEIPESGLAFPVRWVCPIEQVLIQQEGAEPSEWATVRVEQDYDGYGQSTTTRHHGIVHRGPPEMPSACGPCESEGVYGACGSECSGDERITETETIAPGAATSGRWILGRPSVTRVRDGEGALASEERTYYDGEDFVGLAAGRLDRGLITRVTRRVSAARDETIDVVRNARDAHGNVIATLDPLGDAADMGGHRRAYVYDADGLRLARTEIFLSTPEGEPYRLTREYAYDEGFGQATQQSGWVRDGAVSAADWTFYRYDEHGRLVAMASPGDTLERPTMEVEWQLASPASRVIIRRRSEAGAERADLEMARCIDGRGRTFQERQRVRDGEWITSGFTAFNRRGAAVRTYQPYQDTSSACPTAEPTGVAFEQRTYDGMGRELRRVLPDLEGFATASESRAVFGPLSIERWDETDTDASGPHAGTPRLMHVDGLGRTVAIERRLHRDGGSVISEVTRLEYDGLGRLARHVDALGNVKTQEHDLLGRIVRVDDPSSGITTFEHDAAGNEVSRTDARGVTTRSAYEGANRIAARWDAEDPEGTRVTYRYDHGASCGARECENGEGELVETTYPLPQELTALLGGAPVGSDRRSYDARGRLVTRVRALGDATLVTEQRWDGADRLIETVYPDGQVIAVRHDGASRVIGIDGVIDAVEFNGRGQMRRIARADGSEDVMGYDALMRLTTLASTSGDGSLVQELTIERDRLGSITAIADDASPLGLGGRDSRYGHDDLDRVTEVQLARSDEELETAQYAFDAIDRLTSATSSRGAASAAHVGDYEYVQGGLATRAGALEMAHDEAGHLITRGDAALVWDHRGRLVESASGAAQSTHVYGPDQERIATLADGGLTIYVTADFEIRDGVGRAYARVAGTRIARMQSTELGASLYGDPSGDGVIDASDAWIARGAARGDVMLRAAARRVLHEAAPEPVQLFHDHLGSLIGASREGELVGARRFLPYGELDAERGFVDEHGFTGQERDPHTGLLHFEWRELDPYTGLWTRPDPLFETTTPEALQQSLEPIARLAYVLGNPVDFADPDGLMRNGRANRPSRARQFLRGLRAAGLALVNIPGFATFAYGVEHALDGAQQTFTSTSDDQNDAAQATLQYAYGMLAVGAVLTLAVGTATYMAVTGPAEVENDAHQTRMEEGMRELVNATPASQQVNQEMDTIISELRGEIQ